MNKMTKLTVASVAVAGLAFGAVGCADQASDDFKKVCKDAGGEVKRESEVLGMSAVAFVAKGGGRGSTRSGTRNSTSGGGSWFGSSDEDWVCAKDGVKLFEEG